MTKLFFCLLTLLVVFSADVHAQEDPIPRFEIRRYVLQGNTLILAQELEKILSQNIGKDRDFGDIQETVERLEHAYHSRGYPLATVVLPEQELTTGEITLQAIEPQVREISIAGNNHFSTENILANLPTLKNGESPRLTQISENLRATNENPFRKISLRFVNLEKPEDLKALLQVTDQKPWRISLDFDNTGNRQIGEFRTGLSLQHGNLFGRDHIATLHYTTSPDHVEQVNSISGSYRIPFYALGDTLDLFGGYSDVDSGTSQISGTGLTIKGKGLVSGFRYTMNLQRSGGYEQKLNMGMDYRRYENTAMILDVDLAPDVVAHPLTLGYNGIFQSDRVSADFFGNVLHNEPWGGQGKQSDFRAVRSEAVADYWIFRYGFNKMLRLPRDWMVRVAGNGQFTPDRLVPGEQFGLGGSLSVRGYEEREESWDAGFSGNLELYSPNMAQLLNFPDLQLRLIGFFDGGTGYNIRPQPDELHGNTLQSVGTGVRLGFRDLFSFTLDWGYALDRSNQTSRGDSAVHLKGQISY